jgi:GNAT superfamily N-acetyltransferase
MTNAPVRTWRKKGYALSTDPARLDMDFVHRELGRSYWSPGVPRSVVEKAVANSLTFGLYRADGTQVGYARLVTDMATFAYLADVIVTEAERGKGLGRWMNERIVAHPDLQTLRRWMLATRDAHGLYRRFGWAPLKAPERFMERHFPNVYKKPARTASSRRRR